MKFFGMAIFLSLISSCSPTNSKVSMRAPDLAAMSEKQEVSKFNQASFAFAPQNNLNPLAVAIINNDHLEIQKLIDLKMDLNAMIPHPSVAGVSITYLQLAILTATTDVLEALLKGGANVSLLSSENLSSFAYANNIHSLKRYFEVIELLKVYGHQVDPSDEDLLISAFWSLNRFSYFNQSEQEIVTTTLDKIDQLLMKNRALLDMKLEKLMDATILDKLGLALCGVNVDIISFTQLELAKRNLSVSMNCHP